VATLDVKLAAMERFEASSDTIACTLTAEDLEDTRRGWEKLFRTSLVSRDLVPGGLRLAFTASGEAPLRQLVDIETECCQWITFELDGSSLTMTAAGDGEEAIRSMWVVDAPGEEATP
jgi:hypothetical protein